MAPLSASVEPTPVVVSGLWPFDDDSTYTSSSGDWLTSTLEITGGVCRLKASDQLDSGSGITGFSGGTFWGVSDYNTLSGEPSSSGLKLQNNGGCDGSAVFCSAELKSNWTPGFSYIVAYWKMDNDWNDSIGTNHLTPVNTPTFGADNQVGGTHAVAFNGSTQYATIADNSNFQFGSGDFSISYWFYSRNSCSSWDNTFGVNQWSGGDATPGANSWNIGNCNDSTNTFRAAIESGSTRYGVSALSNWTTGNWYHLVMSRIGSDLSFYVNGELQGSADVSTLSVNNLGRNFRIANSDSNTYLTRGTFDEIAIWKGYGLTETDVRTIYANQMDGVYAATSGTFISRIMDAWASGQSWTSFSWTPTLPFFKGLPDYSSGSVQNETSTTYSSLVGSTGITGANDLMSNIAGLWHFDNTWADTSGQGNNGSNSGDSGFSTNSIIGTHASTFDGTGDFAQFGDASDLVLTDNFTLSLWAKVSNTSAGSDQGIISKMVGTGANGWSIHHTSGNYIQLQVCSSGACTSINSNSTYTDKAWHHLVYKRNSGNNFLYVDGELQTSNNSQSFAYLGSEILSIGRKYSDLSQNYLTGAVDEVAIWSRGLRALEIVQLYQRGAARLKFQVRSCNDSACAGETWMGPDGTSATFFSEVFNTSSQSATPTGTINISLPVMTFSNFTAPSNNRYFQYRAIFENYSSTASYGPELKQVVVEPVHYDSTSPHVIGDAGLAFETLNDFTQTLSGGCAGGVTYNLGLSNAGPWKYWNSANWVDAIGTVAQSNDDAVIQSNISAFASDVGTGAIYFKAYLNSNGQSECSLDEIQIDGE